MTEIGWTMKSPGFPLKDDFRIVVIPPMGYAYTAFIDGDLDSMQAVVGGNIEHLALEVGRLGSDGRGIDFWCNEEFLYTPGMTFNRVVEFSGGFTQEIFGPMFCCGFIERNGSSCGLTASEALSVLTDERASLAAPQLLIVDDGLSAAMQLDGCSDESVARIACHLPADALLSNRIIGPLSKWDGDEILTPMPIVGKPEDIVVGKWRVHLVYPGEMRADGGCAYDADEARNLGMGLPIVEFYDISQSRKSWPLGQFVSSYFMSTLMNLDGMNPESAVGKGLDSRQGIALNGSVDAWSITGTDYQVAKCFIARAHEACMAHRISMDPSEAARIASDIASRSRSTEGPEAADHRHGL